MAVKLYSEIAAEAAALDALIVPGNGIKQITGDHLRRTLRLARDTADTLAEFIKSRSPLEGAEATMYGKAGGARVVNFDPNGATECIATPGGALGTQPFFHTYTSIVVSGSSLPVGFGQTMFSIQADTDNCLEMQASNVPGASHIWFVKQVGVAAALWSFINGQGELEGVEPGIGIVGKSPDGTKRSRWALKNDGSWGGTILSDTGGGAPPSGGMPPSLQAWIDAPTGSGGAGGDAAIKLLADVRNGVDATPGPEVDLVEDPRDPDAFGPDLAPFTPPASPIWNGAQAPYGRIEFDGLSMDLETALSSAVRLPSAAGEKCTLWIAYEALTVDEGGVIVIYDETSGFSFGVIHVNPGSGVDILAQVYRGSNYYITSGEGVATGLRRLVFLDFDYDTLTVGLEVYGDARATNTLPAGFTEPAAKLYVGGAQGAYSNIGAVHWGYCFGQVFTPAQRTALFDELAAAHDVVVSP